ncbi:DNA recombination protein RmuC [Nisaea sp.]|uniref:DNA recombination protein RmuC n=1 Tax=Nisaea sp. TaxID=2024842 RepID=UPI0032662BB3
MDGLTLILAVVAAGAVLLAAIVLLKGRGTDPLLAAALEEAARRQAEQAERATTAQAELAGRVTQLSENHAAAQARIAELMQVQEREVTKRLDERLADVSKKVGESLEKSSTKAQSSLSELQQRLAVIDTAQKNITELSTQVVGLQDILSNKQARGAFGEIQLNDLVKSILPPNAYRFQVQIGDNRRVDCLIDLPNPPGSIAIDAKFPLESYHALSNATNDAEREAARKQMAVAILKHVKDISSRYIVPGETAESALMFLPSEAIYAELHANLSHVVEQSWKERVWIVSPTTLMATLNTVRAVLKDARMREQAHVIQAEVRTMMTDVGRLDDRVGKLETHFRQAEKDIGDIRTSTNKITRRGDKIEEIELGTVESAADAAEDLLGKVDALPLERE